jgi:FeS assembly SUF system regulator
MFRLSKLTDYGIVILAELARHTLEGQSDGECDSLPSLSARELATSVDLPLPMVSKVLKTLTRSGALESQRGTKGGYSLARHPDELSVTEMISALEGPVALTQCSEGPAVCDLEATCAMRGPWRIINDVVHEALASISLADLTHPDYIAGPKPLTRLITLGLLAKPAAEEGVSDDE